MNQDAVKKALLNLFQDLEAQIDSDGSVRVASPQPVTPGMTSKVFILLAVAAVCFFVTNLAAITATADSAETYDDAVEQMLEDIRFKYKLPALAGAAVRDGEIVALGAVGSRKQGDPTRVEKDDRFHIGSLTKSMTATVAAMLVEDGVLSWTTTIEEVFPDFADSIHPDYRNATLEQLLAHRAGAPANPPASLWRAAWRAQGTPTEQRMQFVRGLLERKPEAYPGEEYIYSNQGYAIAGTMLEVAGGLGWEELMCTRLFQPLGMTTAGFGPPASPGNIDQPWGHRNQPLAGNSPVPPGPQADNPAAIGPAGTVHGSVEDLTRYAIFHLNAANGKTDLLHPESVAKLHTPVEGQDYSLGWIVTERSWAGGRALTHAGSNTMFYALIWLAPERDLALIAATNSGASNAFSACDETVVNLLRSLESE